MYAHKEMNLLLFVRDRTTPPGATTTVRFMALDRIGRLGIRDEKYLGKLGNKFIRKVRNSRYDVGKLGATSLGRLGTAVYQLDLHRFILSLQPVHSLCDRILEIFLYMSRLSDLLNAKDAKYIYDLLGGALCQCLTFHKIVQR